MASEKSVKRERKVVTKKRGTHTRESKFINKKEMKNVTIVGLQT